jgi:hypothetical protein
VLPKHSDSNGYERKNGAVSRKGNAPRVTAWKEGCHKKALSEISDENSTPVHGRENEDGNASKDREKDKRENMRRIWKTKRRGGEVPRFNGIKPPGKVVAAHIPPNAEHKGKKFSRPRKTRKIGGQFFRSLQCFRRPNTHKSAQIDISYFAKHAKEQKLSPNASSRAY